MGVMDGKRPYRRQDELRELLISHGVELLLESSPADRDAVTLARVFERVQQAGQPRVTKGSVLGVGRVWPSQREFQRDVEIAAAELLGGIEDQLGASMAAAASVLEQVNLRTKAGRMRAAQQLCRAAGQAYFEELVGSRVWRLWVGLWGRMAVTTDEIAAEGLGASLRQAQSGSLERLVSQLYAPLAELVDYRGKPEYGTTKVALDHLAVAVLGLTDGTAIHQRLFPEHFELVERFTGPEGEPELWHPFSIALDALVHQYLEPAPRPTRSPIVPVKL
jgi:hypothetical protein